MIGMWKHTWLAAVLGLCLHCGGGAQSTPAETPEPAPPSEPAAVEPAEPAEEPPAEAPAEPSEGEAGEGSGEQSSGESSGSGKKSCAELDQSTCKITIGCAWNDVKKCVEEGVPE